MEKSCKLGKTENIPDRDTQYATGEIRRGWFEPVFELYFSTNIDIKIMNTQNRQIFFASLKYANMNM